MTVSEQTVINPIRSGGLLNPPPPHLSEFLLHAFNFETTLLCASHRLVNTNF